MLLRAEDLRRGPLLLVNAGHPMEQEPAPRLSAPDRHCPDVLLEHRAAALLADCIRSAGGRGAIVPVSGWRSRGEQQSIWDDSLAEHGPDFTRRYVARPGCSEHETGLAIDLAQAAEHIDFIRPFFPHYGPFGAFRRLAADYGFVQRYRRDKEAVTGIAEEPWHFRYVGAPHAALMEAHGLCLEEYGALLRQAPRRWELCNGRRVRVSYLPCPGPEAELDLPEDACVQVSGYDGSGFVVTLWEAVS